MKSLLLVVFISIVIIGITASKTQKNNYWVRWDRQDIENNDLSFVNVTGSLIFLNRTMKAVAVRMEFHKVLSDDAIIKCIMYKWIQNAWMKYSAMEITVTAKQAIGFHWFDIKRYFQTFEPPIVNHFEAKTYVQKGYTFDADQYPPYIPIGSYLADIQYFQEALMEHKLFRLKWFVTLVPYKQGAHH